MGLFDCGVGKLKPNKEAHQSRYCEVGEISIKCINKEIIRNQIIISLLPKSAN